MLARCRGGQREFVAERRAAGGEHLRQAVGRGIAEIVGGPRDRETAVCQRGDAGQRLVAVGRLVDEEFAATRGAVVVVQLGTHRRARRVAAEAALVVPHDHVPAMRERDDLRVALERGRRGIDEAFGPGEIEVDWHPVFPPGRKLEGFRLTFNRYRTSPKRSARTAKPAGP